LRNSVPCLCAIFRLLDASYCYQVNGTFARQDHHHYDDYSKDIFESGDHLLSLINDILDISKIEAGHAELDETEVDIAKVVGDCRRLVEVRAQEAGLFVFEEVGNDPLRLNADPRMVKQMLLNLLSNAIKFSDGGGEIKVICKVSGDGALRVSVIDTGIGIAAQDLPKALSTFGQIDGALDRKFEGTGLGLPLVKSLAELHSGGLEIESEVGVGTKATIWFPKERAIKNEAKPSIQG
jgi:signal transduction histidine kinase